MKKYLLLTGLLAVLTFNNVFADELYYKNGKYYTVTPQNHHNSAYKESTYQREQQHYRKMTNVDARKYEERQVYRNKEQSTDRIRPYIGFDIARTKIKPEDNEDKEDFKLNLTAFKGIIGARINKNWSIEGFYQMTGEEKKSQKINPLDFYETTISYKSYGADIIRYIPINQDFEILAALGLGQYDFEAKAEYLSGKDNPYYPPILRINEKEKKDFDSLGIRLGLGVQYNINNNIAVQGMVRYIHMTDDDYVKNLTEFSLGLRYIF